MRLYNAARYCGAHRLAFKRMRVTVLKVRLYRVLIATSFPSLCPLKQSFLLQNTYMILLQQIVNNYLQMVHYIFIVDNYISLYSY